MYCFFLTYANIFVHLLEKVPLFLLSHLHRDGKKILANSIAVGYPAKVIKTLDSGYIRPE
jgi:hypothetical protein